MSLSLSTWPLTQLQRIDFENLWANGLMDSFTYNIGGIKARFSWLKIQFIFSLAWIKRSILSFEEQWYTVCPVNYCPYQRKGNI
jgi:hypothetical protein